MAEELRKYSGLERHLVLALQFIIVFEVLAPHGMLQTK